MTEKRLTPVARRVRVQSTEAEKLLWARLRSRQVEGAKFVRQFPVGPFVTDFACRSHHLAVELDGGQHGGPRDEARTRAIQAHGYQVVRFWNSEVIENLEGVLEAIAIEIHRIR